MLDLKNAGLTELLNNFYTLTGLKLCIFDTDFEECASTPIKLYPLCLRAREDPEFERRCHSCDAAHMQAPALPMSCGAHGVSGSPVLRGRHRRVYLHRHDDRRHAEGI